MPTFIETQDSILEMIKSIGETEKFDVFETSLPVGYELTEKFGQHNPYVLVSFGGKSPVAMDNQGITGTRDDIKWTSLAIEVVANSPRTVRIISDIIRNEISGYEPSPTWGQLVERMSGDYAIRQPDFDLWPVRFAIGMVFNTNADA